MAGTANARRFTDEDKARVYATLTANGGNVKRTARECDVPPATIRRWRGQWEREGSPPEEAVQAAAQSFVDDAKRVRNKALVLLEQKINEGDIKPGELNTVIGTLDDKIRLHQGLATSRVERTSTLPPADELRALMSGFVQGAIAAAEQRSAEIVEAEVVEERPALPA